MRKTEGWGVERGQVENQIAEVRETPGRQMGRQSRRDCEVRKERAKLRKKGGKRLGTQGCKKKKNKKKRNERK